MATIKKHKNENLNDYEARLRELFTNQKISADDFFGNSERECSKLYLSRDNPRAQSGR